jgi:membrane-associated PAP2 superfamily phosphatase
MLADRVYDAGLRAFTWRHAWLTETFSHVILKGPADTGCRIFRRCGCLGCLASTHRARCSGPAAAARRGLSAVLVPLVISMLKQKSVAHCPWDLARYGGTEPYLRLFDALPLGVHAGHCLPAGHASSALWMVSLCVYWLPGRPQGARLAALAALLFGGLVGWMQQLRGAHFLTHTLWSIWLASAVVLVVIVALQWRPVRREATAPDYLADAVEEAR